MRRSYPGDAWPFPRKPPVGSSFGRVAAHPTEWRTSTATFSRGPEGELGREAGSELPIDTPLGAARYRLREHAPPDETFARQLAEPVRRREAGFLGAKTGRRDPARRPRAQVRTPLPLLAGESWRPSGPGRLRPDLLSHEPRHRRVKRPHVLDPRLWAWTFSAGRSRSACSSRCFWTPGRFSGRTARAASRCRGCRRAPRRFVGRP